MSIQSTISTPPHQKLSVLVDEIQEVIRGHFNHQLYWVVAEVSSHKFYANQDRHYLELIEKNDQQLEPLAKIKATVWKEGAARIREFESQTGQRFQDGLQVLVQVKVQFHASYGLSVTITDINIDFTLGNVARQRQETIRRLMEENPGKVWREGERLVTYNQTLLLPVVVQRIALIGSPNSEGYGDFMHTITQNQFQYKFHIDTYQSSVQGASAEQELVHTLIAIYQSNQPYDIVVIIRGGGAKTDFLVFETYAVSRAIARFPIPVITGIGHLGDQSIADMMAYIAMNAPTKVAEYIIAQNRRFEEQINRMQQLVIIQSQQQLTRAQQTLQLFRKVLTVDTLQQLYTAQTEIRQYQHIWISKPHLWTQRRLQQMAFLSTQLKSYTQKLIKQQQTSLHHYQTLTQMMHVDRVLQRGFAIVYKRDQVIHRANQVETGDSIQIVLHEGNMEATVAHINQTNHVKAN
jgi:exodeoxyribonuclease VII large subunit